MSLRLPPYLRRPGLAVASIARFRSFSIIFLLRRRDPLLCLQARHASSSKPRSRKKAPPSKPPTSSYKPSPHHPSPPPDISSPSESPSLTQHSNRSLRPYAVVASFFVFATSAYIGILYAQLHSEPPASSDPAEQDNTLTLRYDTTAPEYDAAVEQSEYWQGIARLRRQLVGRAKGRVLEVCAGTGRNLEFYDFGERKGWAEGMLGKGGVMTRNKKKKATTETTPKTAATAATAENDDGGDVDDDNIVTELICVDRSAAMLDIARAKWAKLHPHPHSSNDPDPDPDSDSRSTAPTPTAKVTFLTQSADATLPLPLPLPPPPTPSTPNPQPPPPPAPPSPKFTTTIQTLGLCSLPHPTLHLLHLATLTDPQAGKILLLEHGRSDWSWVNWILDRSAARHAHRHGCWFNRDIGAVLRQCEEAGVLVVEEVRRPWWGLGTVWWVVARVGGRLGGGGG